MAPLSYTTPRDTIGKGGVALGREQKIIGGSTLVGTRQMGCEIARNRPFTPELRPNAFPRQSRRDQEQGVEIGDPDVFRRDHSEPAPEAGWIA